MKILLVSSSILPKTGGSSVITENLASNFSREEMLVLGARGIFHKAPARPESGPDFRYFFSELSIFGRGARFFNWFRQMRFNSMVKFMSSIIQTENITHVLGTYPDMFYCLAACRAARLTGRPFSSYFHNTYLENTAISDSRSEEYQKEVFDSSDYVFVMSEGMQEYYLKNYANKKFVPLVHTFSDYPERKVQSIGIEQKNRYNLVAIGNFNESNMDATIRLVNALDGNPSFSLTLYTHVPKLLLEKRGIIPKTINYREAVASHAVHDELQQYDICILTHGFQGAYGQIEYETIFPTRTIPLLLSGKPIFAHLPKKSFINNFLSKHDCAYIVNEPSEASIIEGLTSLISNVDLQKKLVTNALSAASIFDGSKVANRLKTTIGGQSYETNL